MYILVAACTAYFGVCMDDTVLIWESRCVEGLMMASSTWPGYFVPEL